MGIVSEGVLALTEGVPQLDLAIATSGNDLAVVRAEGDGEDIRGVTNKGADRLTAAEVPQTQGLVPRARQGEGTVGGDDDVLDGLVVASQGALSVAARLSLGGEVPADKLLIAGARNESVAGLDRGSDGGNPVAVALEGTLQNERLRHVDRLAVQLLRRAISNNFKIVC